MSAKKMKVISPVEKDGKTLYWNRIGSAFINKDQSINVYLDCFPVSGQLQIRELDERDFAKHDRSPRASSDGERDLNAALQASLNVPPAATQDVPF